MDHFIPAVVQEEEERHKIQESYGADGDDGASDFRFPDSPCSATSMEKRKNPFDTSIDFIDKYWKPAYSVAVDRIHLVVGHQRVQVADPFPRSFHVQVRLEMVLPPRKSSPFPQCSEQ
ncbi:MAG: hypothetical protein Q9186_000606 [Xanthomendoza sp. 1 TL-2023]